jgi:hypothetical protein
MPIARTLAVAFTLTLSTLVITSAARAQAPAPPTALFQALAGHWGCNGGFRDGRKLASDLTFEPVQTGRALRFSHVDRAPGNYWQEATWAFDAKGSRVLSLSMTGSTLNGNASPTMFSGHEWSDREITLNADSLNGPPWAPNRFTYTAAASGQLLMRWEVQRGGIWAFGDSLICARAR